MCGRFTITANFETLAKRFGTPLPLPEYEPRFNAAPGQRLPVILNTSPDKVSLAKWGYLPFWAKSDNPKAIINARDDSLLVKNAFKNAVAERRCLILADGFFEWRQAGKGKVPYYIKMQDEQPFAFAGVYSLNEDDEGHKLPHFAIVTVEPNELIEPIHNRMPAILDKKAEQKWLLGEEVDNLMKLLKPFPANKMKAFPISKLVNSPANDSPEVIYPLNQLV
jgi:putative SOS response-associated peptidase YedK